MGGRGGGFVVYGASSGAPGSVRDLAANPDVVIVDDVAVSVSGGDSVACGDVNGDGHNDIILASPFSNGPNKDRASAGRVAVVFGAGAWPAVIDLAVNPPDLTIWGDAFHSLGLSLAVGDLNGDLIDDILMGAPSANRPGASPAVLAGAVFVIWGRITFATAIDLIAESPDFAFYGEDGGDAAGGKVNVSDLDGDGFDDLLVGAGADGPNNSRPGAGEAYIVYGSGALPPVIDVLGDAGPVPDVRIYGGMGGIGFGDALGASLGACDVNNDGVNDLVVGARRAGGQVSRPQAGAVYIFHGGSLPAVLDVAGEVGPPADAVIWGANGGGTFSDDLLGHQVACGDVNGDGIADIVAVAERGDPPYYRLAEGAIYVYYGSSSLPAVMDIRGELGPPPDVILYSGGGLANTSPGFLKVAAGDVNGDGIDELIAGAPLTWIPPPVDPPDGRSLAGAVFVFNIPRLAALPSPPAATVAHYNANRKRLKITVPGATGSEVVEINGHLIGPWWDIRKPITFDSATSQFVLKGGRPKLFLSSTPGVNTVVIIKDGLRSTPLAF